jgi:hypothetical protein
MSGFLRILRDHDAAAFLDGDQAGGTVIEHPGQHNPDDILTVADRRRAEQRIDSGPETVLEHP